MKKKFGDEFRIASACESKALNWPPIKPEDGTALSRFSIYLASCRNMMKGSQYSSKFDQPDKIQRLVLKLPYRILSIHYTPYILFVCLLFLCKSARMPLALKFICLKGMCAILLAGEVIIPTLFTRPVRLAFSVVLKPKSSWTKLLERSMGSDCNSMYTWIGVILEV